MLTTNIKVMNLDQINFAMGTTFRTKEEFVDTTYRMVAILGPDLVKGLNPERTVKVKEGLETMREHYESLENYEYCAKVKEIIDAINGT